MGGKGPVTRKSPHSSRSARCHRSSGALAISHWPSWPLTQRGGSTSPFSASRCADLSASMIRRVSRLQCNFVGVNITRALVHAGGVVETSSHLWWADLPARGPTRRCVALILFHRASAPPRAGTSVLHMVLHLYRQRERMRRKIRSARGIIHVDHPSFQGHEKIRVPA